MKSGTSARQIAIAVVQVGEERRVEITIRPTGQRREDRREQIVGQIEMSVALILLDRPANAVRTAVLIQVANLGTRARARGERIGYCRG